MTFRRMMEKNTFSEGKFKIQYKKQKKILYLGYIKHQGDFIF